MFNIELSTGCRQVVSSHTLLCAGNGVGTNFGVGVGEARPEGPRAGVGWGYWGGNSQPLTTN